MYKYGLTSSTLANLITESEKEKVYILETCIVIHGVEIAMIYLID